MRESETLVDGDNVSDTITRVQDDTSCTTGSIQGQNGLDGDIEGRGIESLEDNLGHLLSVGLGVDRSFGQKNRVLFGSNTQFVVEGVVPDLLHVVPVGDNTVLDGVSQGEDTTLGLCFITDIRVLLTQTNHDTTFHPLDDFSPFQTVPHTRLRLVAQPNRFNQRAKTYP